jgi:hypothetical protein
MPKVEYDYLTLFRECHRHVRAPQLLEVKSCSIDPCSLY